jgi:hypothetical protein
MPRSDLEKKLIADGLKPKGPQRSLSELLAEHRAMQAMLRRILKLADSGYFRDHARLSIGATPVMDDARELLKACEAPRSEGRAA